MGCSVIPEYFDKNCMVYQYDGLMFLSALSPESVQLVWTSPPFAEGFTEEDTKSVAEVEAVELCAAVADAAFRILSPTGTLVLSVPDQSADDVVTAVGKRTHFQPEGFIWDNLGIDAAAVVFRKNTERGVYRIGRDWPDGKVELISAFIRSFTALGDFVVDPFCGTGDVMEAAVRASRVAVVNDKDPLSVENTINRYKEYRARY